LNLTIKYIDRINGIVVERRLKRSKRAHPRSLLGCQSPI